MPGLGEIIGLIQTLGQMNNQRRQLDLQQQSQRTSAYGQFSDLLAHEIDPAQRRQLLSSFAAQTGVDSKALEDLAAGYQTPVATSQAYAVNQGMRHAQGAPQDPGALTPDAVRLYGESANTQLTGRSAGDNAQSGASQQSFDSVFGPQAAHDDFNRMLQSEFASRAVGGASTGALHSDMALASLSPQQLATAHEYNLNLKRNPEQIFRGNVDVAGQVLQGNIAGEQLNQGDRRMMLEKVIADMTNQTNLTTRGKGPGKATSQQIDDAQKRLAQNTQFLTSKATTESSRLMLLDMIKDDYDTIHGEGEYLKRFGDLKDTRFNPGALSHILSNQ